MKKSFFTTYNGGCAAFDDFMLYPFFSKKEESAFVLNTILDDEVSIEEVSGIALDQVRGVFSGGVGIRCMGRENEYYVVIKRIEESFSFEEEMIVYYYLLHRLQGRAKSPMVPVIVLIDEKRKDEECLIRRTLLHNEYMADVLKIEIFPFSPTEGRVKNTFLELNRGSRGEVADTEIRKIVSGLTSESGISEFSDYWESTELRWRFNVGDEMVRLGLSIEEVCSILEFYENDAIDFLTFNIVKNRYLNALRKGISKINSDHD